MKIISTLLVFTSIVAMAFLPAKGLKVTSPVFKAGGHIPGKYSCDGKEVNPPLNIAHMPAGTKSLAIIVHDPDAPVEGGVTHWVAWNIKPMAKVPENANQGVTQGLNSSNQLGYKGMCPPSGTHHYHFKVYALDKMLDIDPRSARPDLEKAMTGHILARGELVGLYSKK